MLLERSNVLQHKIKLLATWLFRVWPVCIHLSSCSLASAYTFINVLKMDHIFQSTSALRELGPAENPSPAVDVEHRAS